MKKKYDKFDFVPPQNIVEAAYYWCGCRMDTINVKGGLLPPEFDGYEEYQILQTLKKIASKEFAIPVTVIKNKKTNCSNYYCPVCGINVSSKVGKQDWYCGKCGQRLTVRGENID